MPDELYVASNGEALVLGTPLVHLRCMTCGHIGLDGYGGIDRLGCALCGSKVEPTIYVSMPVGTDFTERMVKGVLSQLFENRDNRNFSLVLKGMTDEQKAVVDAAVEVAKHTTAPKGADLHEVARKASALLSNLNRAVERLVKKG